MVQPIFREGEMQGKMSANKLKEAEKLVLKLRAARVQSNFYLETLFAQLDSHQPIYVDSQKNYVIIRAQDYQHLGKRQKQTQGQIEALNSKLNESSQEMAMLKSSLASLAYENGHLKAVIDKVKARQMKIKGNMEKVILVSEESQKELINLSRFCREKPTDHTKNTVFLPASDQPSSTKAVQTEFIASEVCFSAFSVVGCASISVEPGQPEDIRPQSWVQIVNTKYLAQVEQLNDLLGSYIAMLSAKQLQVVKLRQIIGQNESLKHRLEESEGKRLKKCSQWQQSMHDLLRQIQQDWVEYSKLTQHNMQLKSTQIKCSYSDNQKQEPNEIACEVVSPAQCSNHSK